MRLRFKRNCLCVFFIYQNQTRVFNENFTKTLAKFGALAAKQKPAVDETESTDIH